MSEAYSTGFDAHTHLDAPAFDPDRDEVVARAHRAGVTGWAIAATRPGDWARVRTIARKTDAVACLGCHPWHADRDVDALVAALERHDPAVIGEIGLDGLRGPDDAVQEAAFRAQLALARDLDRPAVLHCVRRADRLIHLLARDGAPRCLLHGFEGTADQVRRAVSLGHFVSVGPAIVRGAGRRRAEMVRAIPPDRLLLETDCPDRPVPRARRGEPAHLVAVARAVGAIRGEDGAAVLARTGTTARRFFGSSG